jgi:poly-gamma-glutamate synthesis protein (capsule biosynthesis protein)
MNKSSVLLIVLNIIVITAVINLSVVSFVDEESSEVQISTEKPIAIEPETKNAVTILAVGDIMLGRYVESLSNKNGDNYAFTYFSEFLSGQDLVMGNLEGPIITNHVQTPDFTTSFSFDKKVAETLSTNGFTHLNLANNHTYDRGEQGFLETKTFLEESGIYSFGNPSILNTESVLVQTVKDIEFAFVGFNEAVSQSFDLEKAVEVIREVKSDNPMAIIVVNIHWGTEYQSLSNEKQQNIAQKLIANGVETIIGHHPHVTQEVAEIEGKTVFYSLGNFIFDQYFSVETQTGLAVNLIFDKNGLVRYEPIEVEIDKSRPKIK